jgi:hypothetical protein
MSYFKCKERCSPLCKGGKIVQPIRTAHWEYYTCDSCLEYIERQKDQDPLGLDRTQSLRGGIGRRKGLKSPR